MDKIKIITGDGSNIEISEAHDHIVSEKRSTNSNKPKNIIVPSVKSKSSEEKSEKENKD